MIKTYYYAIDKDGQGWYYDNPPIFDGESWNKVVTVHGHTLELDMGPSCPNPGIRRQLDAKGEPYMCTSDLTTWIGIDGDWYGVNNDYQWTSATDDVFKDCVIPATTFDKGPLQFEIDEQLNITWYKE